VCSGMDEITRRGGGGGRRRCSTLFIGGDRVMTGKGNGGGGGWRGVPRDGVRWGRGAWFQPAGGIPTDSGSAVARAGGATAARTGGAPDAWVSADGGRERERRKAGVRGPAQGKKKWAESAGTGAFLIYSNKIQTSLNYFDQKEDLPSPKNSK
jgi:hypothetical protein